jgi:hypothetical protein
VSIRWEAEAVCKAEPSHPPTPLSEFLVTRVLPDLKDKYNAVRSHKRTDGDTAYEIPLELAVAAFDYVLWACEAHGYGSAANHNWLETGSGPTRCVYFLVDARGAINSCPRVQ